MTQQPRNQPRDLGRHAWYYVKDRSVDVVTTEGHPIVRLRESALRRMLSELRPKRGAPRRR